MASLRPCHELARYVVGDQITDELDKALIARSPCPALPAWATPTPCLLDTRSAVSQVNRMAISRWSVSSTWGARTPLLRTPSGRDVPRACGLAVSRRTRPDSPPSAARGDVYGARDLRCSFRRIVPEAGGGFYRSVRCTRGAIRVDFRLALD